MEKRALRNFFLPGYNFFLQGTIPLVSSLSGHNNRGTSLSGHNHRRRPSGKARSSLHSSFEGGREIDRSLDLRCVWA